VRAVAEPAIVVTIYIPLRLPATILFRHLAKTILDRSWTWTVWSFRAAPFRHLAMTILDPDRSRIVSLICRSRV
jgi:hypothetical protein